MIYILDNIEEFNEDQINKAKKILPLERLKKFNQYIFFKDKRLSCLVYLLFLYGMMYEKKIDFYSLVGVQFSYNRNGKPYLKGMESIEFNFSHCDEAVACGISEYPVGVDVQGYEEIIDEDGMKIVFSKEEISDLKSSDSPEKKFARYWTIKESYYKCIGTGLTDTMNEKNFAVGNDDVFYVDNFCFHTQSFNRFQISVCEKNISSDQIGFIFVSHEKINLMIENFTENTNS